MRTLYVILLFSFCAPGLALAQTPIYKCKSADGGVVYSQLPCKDEAPAEAEEPVRDEAVEGAIPLVETIESLPLEEAVEDEAASETKAACKRRYRDEIDVVDAELRRETSREKDDEYKKRLLALTRKLRAC